MMTDALLGKSLDEAQEIYKAFHDMLTSENKNDFDLEKLAIFESVKQFPVRVKCATLCCIHLTLPKRRKRNEY